MFTEHSVRQAGNRHGRSDANRPYRARGGNMAKKPKEEVDVGSEEQPKTETKYFSIKNKYDGKEPAILKADEYKNNHKSNEIEFFIDRGLIRSFLAIDNWIITELEVCKECGRPLPS